MLGAEAPTRFRVAPDPVTVTGGRRFELRVGWRGIDDDRAWLGYVAYDDSALRTYLTLD